jgi:hypothetical protein
MAHVLEGAFLGGSKWGTRVPTVQLPLVSLDAPNRHFVPHDHALQRRRPYNIFLGNPVTFCRIESDVPEEFVKAYPKARRERLDNPQSGLPTSIFKF